MKLLARRKADQNEAAVDPWTAVHFSAGLTLGLTNVSFLGALTLSLGYEIFEQYAERQKWGKSLLETTGPESLPNVIADIIVLLAGHRLGRLWNRRT